MDNQTESLDFKTLPTISISFTPRVNSMNFVNYIRHLGEP